MTEPAPHPYGRGRPLSESERVRFDAIAADLSGDRPRVGRRPRTAPTHQARRLTARSGWPAWLVAVVGVLLVLWGGLHDQGAPLLIGVILVGTFTQWLRLPPLLARRRRAC